MSDAASDTPVVEFRNVTKTFNPGTARAYTAPEIGALLDLGYNNFIWNGTTGNWADNVASTATPRWQNVEGANSLSPVGTIDPDRALHPGLVRARPAPLPDRLPGPGRPLARADHAPLG